MEASFEVVAGSLCPEGAEMDELTERLLARARAALPPVEGEVRIPGLRRPVEVVRDRWGVPHLYAQDLHDLYLAQGYLQASERLFQVELVLRTATGRLAELLGELALPMDRFARTVGWHRAGARQAGRWDDLSVEMAEAFFAGCRAWVETMPAPPLEYQILATDPDLPPEGRAAEVAAAAGAFMAWSLSGNWDAELLRTEVADRLGWEAVLDLFPDLPPDPPSAVPGKRGGGPSPLDLLREAPPLPRGQGSNAWVVAGRRSATGRPLLANDPHLLAQHPSVWFEVHLSGPGVDVRGVALPFAPGVVIGHNGRIAWGFTNVGGDTQDLYLERLREDGRAVLYEGRWEPLVVHREEVRVRGRARPEVVEVRETRHGPILDSYLLGVARPRVVEGGVRETYALRWVGATEGVMPSVVHRLDTATTWEEFRQAAAGWRCPGQNMVYADVDGNIGYQCTGAYPVRRAGDGTVPVPGWTARYEWEGFVPFEELPWALNPEDGFLVTANNRPHGDSYPHLLGRDFVPPFRARRIARLLAEREVHDHRSFARIQLDTFSLPAAALVPLLLEVEPADDRQKRALTLLADWDLRLEPDSAAAALYEVWCHRVAEAVLRPRLGEELYAHYYAHRQSSNVFQYEVLPNLLAHPSARWFGRDGRAARDEVLRRALDAALDELAERLGEDAAGWEWGRLHRVRFAGPLAAVPDLAGLFTAAEGPLGGDEQTVLQGMFEPGASYEAVVVPSWRQVVDLSDLDASLGTHTVGQSGNPASPHFADLFPLWSTGRYHGMPFTRPAVEREAEARLRLVPPPV
jgi:penicillin amidase